MLKVGKCFYDVENVTEADIVWRIAGPNIEIWPMVVAHALYAMFGTDSRTRTPPQLEKEYGVTQWSQ